MKPKTLARHTAELIASELFSYGHFKVHRLVMDIDQHPRISGPGWGEEVVADKIESLLNRRHLGKGMVKK